MTWITMTGEGVHSAKWDSVRLGSELVPFMWKIIIFSMKYEGMQQHKSIDLWIVLSIKFRSVSVWHSGFFGGGDQWNFMLFRKWGYCRAQHQLNGILYWSLWVKLLFNSYQATCWHVAKKNCTTNPRVPRQLPSLNNVNSMVFCTCK